MSYSLINRPAVRVDILNAVEYYKAISPELAKKFLSRLKEASVSIVGTHYGFQIKHNTVRTLLLKQFPYHIHYLINEEKKQIIVLAIIHAYRNPKDYTDR